MLVRCVEVPEAVSSIRIGGGSDLARLWGGASIFSISSSLHVYVCVCIYVRIGKRVQWYSRGIHSAVACQASRSALLARTSDEMHSKSTRVQPNSYYICT